MTTGAFVWLEERAKRTLSHEDFRRILPQVRRAVMRVRLDEPGTTFAELAAWAWVAVLDAVERDDIHGPDLEAYAMYRVNGALLDALASLDPKKKDLRALSARLAATIRRLKARFGRPPSEREIAQALGYDEAHYERALRDLASAGFARLEVVGVPPSLRTVAFTDSIGIADRPDLLSAVSWGLDDLPPRSRDLFELHYVAELPLEEAARYVGLDADRAIALHAEGIHRLRAAVARD
jgi:RNA polymerase sigma factor FliA